MGEREPMPDSEILERGRVPGMDAATIRQQLADLQRMQTLLEGMLTRIEGEARRSKDDPPADRGESPPPPSCNWAAEGRKRPIRDVVLDALQDLKGPAYTREMALYCQARFGRQIAATRFGTLAADEEKAFLRPNRKPRALWLCFAVTFDRHQPIKRLLARSDWPLTERIVAPTTGRVQHLRMTRRLCELALEVGENAADPEMMRIIAADHARDVLGVRLRRGEFDLAGWQAAAQAQLAELLPEDLRLRTESAARLATRPLRVQLFGIPDVLEGGRVDFAARRGEA